MMASEHTTAEGPYFDELAVGDVFHSAPGVTLTQGLAAVHQSIVGGRLPLVLDTALCAEVTGADALAPPGLVWDLAIGQSTVATHHVKANLFYRGLVFRRAPELGDTLRTTTEVVGLRQNRSRPGRHPTGLVALRITTADQYGRSVLDFWRCAMLPLREGDRDAGRTDDLELVGTGPTVADLVAVGQGWRLARFAERVNGPRFADLAEGQRIEVAGGDVVSGAPELARTTLNVARVHHDAAAADGQRLVYGGHTIDIALTQACRALPGIVTVAGWHGCDHLGPVHEGATLRSAITVERLQERDDASGLAHLRSVVTADDEQPREVLDWRFIVLLPS